MQIRRGTILQEALPLCTAQAKDWTIPSSQAPQHQIEPLLSHPPDEETEAQG